MGKFKLRDKKIILIIGIIFLLTSGYLGVNYYNSAKVKPDTSAESRDVSNEEVDTRENGEDQNGEEAEEKKAYVEEKKVYSIVNLNKKDGDFFSVPDEVSFTISPTVDRSKITLTSAEGSALYTKEITGSDAKFTVYPEKKITEGAKGELLIQGYIGSNVVVYQKVRVIF